MPAASGVSGQSAEGVESCSRSLDQAFRPLRGSLEGGVEAFRGGVVRAGADRARTLADPADLHISANALLVYCDPRPAGVHGRSGQVPAGPPGGRQGIGDEFCPQVVGDGPPDGSRREVRSTTVARQSGLAPLTGRYVISPTRFVFTSVAVKARSIRSGAGDADGLPPLRCWGLRNIGTKTGAKTVSYVVRRRWSRYGAGYVELDCSGRVVGDRGAADPSVESAAAGRWNAGHA